MLIVDSEWVGCGGILPRIPFKELLLLSPAHDGTATLRLLISGASDSVFFLLLSAHESLLLAQWSLWH